MAELLRVAPLLNTVIIVLTAILALWRINEMLIEYKQTNQRITDSMTKLDKRMTIIETFCAIQHGHRLEHPMQENAQE